MNWDIVECKLGNEVVELFEKRVYNFFCKIDMHYEPAISTRVDLLSYSKRLVSNAKIFFLKKEGLDLGILALYIDVVKSVGFISSIGVMPDVQGFGAGQALMDRAISLCKVKKMTKLQLEVGVLNDKAISFYEKNKFVIVKNNNKSTYIMEREIN